MRSTAKQEGQKRQQKEELVSISIFVPQRKQAESKRL